MSEIERKYRLEQAQKSDSKRNANQDLLQTNPRVILPFVPHFSEKIARIFNQKFGVQTGYIPLRKLETLVTNHKDQENKESKSGIYRIECSCGEVYIGQTGRTLKQRLYEHKNACKKADCKSSAVSEHLINHQYDQFHKIKWEDARFLAHEEIKRVRLFKEAVIIQAHDPGILMNRKEESGGSHLPLIWKSLPLKFWK